MIVNHQTNSENHGQNQDASIAFFKNSRGVLMACAIVAGLIISLVQCIYAAIHSPPTMIWIVFTIGFCLDLIAVYMYCWNG